VVEPLECVAGVEDRHGLAGRAASASRQREAASQAGRGPAGRRDGEGDVAAGAVVVQEPAAASMASGSAVMMAGARLPLV
jgi:hypothetical protein